MMQLTVEMKTVLSLVIKQCRIVRLLDTVDNFFTLNFHFLFTILGAFLIRCYSYVMKKRKENQKGREFWKVELIVQLVQN